MPQADDHSSKLEDDMLPEYDLSKLGRGVRGKHAEAMRQGYSVTIHHNDGSSTTRYVPPQDSISRGNNYNWQGDYIQGDKVMGDKVGGDKVMGDKITHDNSPNQTQASQERRSRKPLSEPRDQIFISYSHQDKDWLSKLQIHLKPLIRKHQFSVWDDTKIVAGAEWYKEIETALATAKVAVLLVSPNFLASDFIHDEELPPLLDAAANEGLTIVWVHLSHSAYRETDINKYQAAHEPSQPLSSLSPAEQDRALVSICQAIKAAMA